MLSRVFIIGNGASLNETPLELLKNEYTIGVNKIGAIFDPTHYVKIDFSQFDGNEWKNEVEPMLGRPCLLWDVFRDGVSVPGEPFHDSIPFGLGDFPNVTWVSRCEHHGNKGYEGLWHEPFCTAHNSIVPMVQWAVKLGFKKIYLVGCDGEFTDGIHDHFMPYYKSVDSGYIDRNNRCVKMAHELIKRSCPIPVVDCTVGGKLNIWERADLTDVLNG